MTDAANASPAGNPPAGDNQQQQQQQPPAGDALLDGAGGTGAQGSTDGDLLSGDEGSEYGGVPESYTFTPPEGVEVNDEIQAALDGFSEFARGIHLDQNQYQQLVEFDAQRAAQLEGQAAEHWNDQVTSWKQGALRDQEIGGAHQKESLAQATAALKKFGTPELNALLRSPSEKNQTGMAIGNHPEILRLLSRVGKALGDPVPVDGDAKPESGDRLQRMYPTMYEGE